MAGWVQHDIPKWIELRVHGVSGTPPESMLEHRAVRRVAGDNASGFYRRVWPVKPPVAGESDSDSDETVLEAYSWGGLTAGSKLRALWLLLIPFLLVNVAFYARPTNRPGARQQLAEAAQRLFALTITASLVLATVNVSMDFAGWQCFRPGGAGSCTSRWVTWLSWPWLSAPARRIAVMALLPVAVIALLWWLANKTWCDNEKTPVRSATPAPDPQRSPLENRRMWNSARPVRRLRAVHIAGAFSLVGVLALVPFVRGSVERPTVGGGLFVVLATVGLGCTVLACLPSMSDRPAADEETTPDRFTTVIAALPRITAGIVAVALLWLALTTPVPTTTPGAPRTSLPWLSAAVHVGILTQLVLLIVMMALLGTKRNRRPTGPDGPTDRERSAAWHGYAPVVLMLFGSALAGAYAAALVLAVAHILGKPMPSDRGIDPLVTPMPYFWAAAIALPIAAAALISAACAYLAVRRAARGKVLLRVQNDYGEQSAGNPYRATAIARQWAKATLDRTFRTVTGWFVFATVALIAAAFLGYVANRSAATDYPLLRGMANVGDWLIGLCAAGMVYLGRQTYRDARTRRLVGVIWDLGTFWPRAVHPLAPPCYAERAVPELVNRLDYLRQDGRSNILLSCHSQGTVLGAAVIMQLTYEQSSSVALLTYGSPLGRLYNAFFPAYFDVVQLHRTGSFLLGGPDMPMEHWPWRNLYRPSDPIGAPVFRDSCIDRCLLDPAFAKPPGDISYPPTLGHSFYPDDPDWPVIVADVKELRTAVGSVAPARGVPSDASTNRVQEQSATVLAAGDQELLEEAGHFHPEAFS